MKRFLVGFCLFFFVTASWEVGAWDQIDYQRLMATKKCVNFGLTEAYLPGADLVFTNLSGVSLVSAYLSGADLNEVNLSAANLEGANLTETSFCGTKMPNGTINNSSC